MNTHDKHLHVGVSLNVGELTDEQLAEATQVAEAMVYMAMQALGAPVCHLLESKVVTGASGTPFVGEVSMN